MILPYVAWERSTPGAEGADTFSGFSYRQAKPPAPPTQQTIDPTRWGRRFACRSNGLPENVYAPTAESGKTTRPSRPRGSWETHEVSAARFSTDPPCID